MIYLDNAATTYPKPKEVYDSLDFAQRNLSFNAGRGTYQKSRECLQVLDDLRKELEEEKPQGSVGRKADCAFMCPIRLDIFLIASLRFSVLFPRFVPKERYAVFILNNEHDVVFI